jgi:hypothetical protein
MFFKRSRHSDIHEGSVYYRLQNNFREQAKVVSVSNDDQGIPHVHYEMNYLQPGKLDPQGRRVLALDCFTSEFDVIN